MIQVFSSDMFCVQVDVAFHFEFHVQKSLELCIYCGMRIINLDFHFGVHDRCGEMELRRRWGIKLTSICTNNICK